MPCRAWATRIFCGRRGEVREWAPGVAKDTVYCWRERKGLPAHRVGRLWKFQLSEVDEWVRAGGADEESGNGSEQK